MHRRYAYVTTDIENNGWVQMLRYPALTLTARFQQDAVDERRIADTRAIMYRRALPDVFCDRSANSAGLTIKDETERTGTEQTLGISLTQHAVALVC